MRFAHTLPRVIPASRWAPLGRLNRRFHTFDLNIAVICPRSAAQCTHCLLCQADSHSLNSFFYIFFLFFLKKKQRGGYRDASSAASSVSGVFLRPGKHFLFYSGVWMEAAALPAPGLWPRGSEVMRAGLTAGSETDESRSLVFFLPLFFSFFLPPSIPLCLLC